MQKSKGIRAKCPKCGEIGRIQYVKRKTTGEITSTQYEHEIPGEYRKMRKWMRPKVRHCNVGRPMTTEEALADLGADMQVDNNPAQQMYNELLALYGLYVTRNPKTGVHCGVVCKRMNLIIRKYAPFFDGKIKTEQTKEIAATALA